MRMRMTAGSLLEEGETRQDGELGEGGESEGLRVCDEHEQQRDRAPLPARHLPPRRSVPLKPVRL